ncbi:class I SAM-dependent methyltransferase [Sphingomonas sp. HHU CXW]|uniref:Class I SAM-dependent methyltransferase n=1 Tax=Sphingomonas hominis TaxID=2741495 RepID=A0ABX2JBV9_9SPHN|nr:class I SAM-dependent methyltransferase [Sphingomonas hominis]NTS63663.1 class I SAM-dependent methyltransferase [Sphingomonas hominis]
MLIEDAATIADLLACPACNSAVRSGPAGADGRATLACTNPDCAHHTGFDRVGGQALLVDFPTSVLDREATLASGGASVVERADWRETIGRVVNGRNHYAAHYARDVVKQLEASGVERPVILVVGGGIIGSGANDLYASQTVGVASFDIYSSPQVTFIGDALSIPFADNSVDAVWVQGVLEVTIDAPKVAAEMQRVLKPNGLLFANVSFMWPVCEGAYDFSRYTASGLRWLFRQCAPLSLGFSNGPGTMAALAIRYLFQALLRSTKAGQIAAFPFAWLRMLDRFCDVRRGLDAAPAIFFYGRKTDTPADFHDAIQFYQDRVPLARAAQKLRD